MTLFGDTKYFFGNAKICSQDFFECRLRSALGHPYKVFKRHCSSTVRSAFFTDVWNSLSRDSVDFSSLKSFRHSLYVLYTYPDSALALLARSLLLLYTLNFVFYFLFLNCPF